MNILFFFMYFVKKENLKRNIRRFINCILMIFDGQQFVDKMFISFNDLLAKYFKRIFFLIIIIFFFFI